MVVDVVDAIIARIEEQGTITPSVVTYAETLIPDEYIRLRPLFMDLAAGTSRCRSLGKAYPGWVYTRVMAEQSTHPLIAQHHALPFDDCSHVCEICTGAGHDALAIANVALRVTSFESDPTIAEVTRSNLRRAGMNRVTIINEAWNADSVVPEGADALWTDPSRRSGTGARHRTTSDYTPAIQDLPLDKFSLVGIKTGPGDEVTNAVLTSFDQEYIGFKRECRERVLWKGAGRAPVSVSLVDANVFWEPHGRRAHQFDADLGTISTLIEPHAAVIASRGVEDLFVELGAQAVDQHIAYGLTDESVPVSALYDRFSVVRIDDGVSEKKIRARLRNLGWGVRTEFKKRGWNGEPEALRSLLPDGDPTDFGVVLIARRDVGHVTIYAKREDPTSV